MEDLRIVSNLVNMDLLDTNGNISKIFGTFIKNAKRQHTPECELREVIELAQSGDWEFAISVIEANINQY